MTPVKRVSRLASTVGLVAHVLTGALYLGSPLVAPPAAVVFLWAGWALLLSVAVVLQRKGDRLTLLVPVASFCFWVLVLSAGERLFGWTA